ncbi:MAG: cysteine-rich CWC family protein [Cuniculiplasma sp.]
MGREKICGVCGSKFICGSLMGCWCTKVKVSPTKRNLISKIASDCLCPDCLKD